MSSNVTFLLALRAALIALLGGGVTLAWIAVTFGDPLHPASLVAALLVAVASGVVSVRVNSGGGP